MLTKDEYPTGSVLSMAVVDHSQDSLAGMGRADTSLRDRPNAIMESSAIITSRRLLDVFNGKSKRFQGQRSTMLAQLPRISAARLEKAYDTAAFRVTKSGEKEETFLYLAYGSNLCHETFQGRRGIRPLAALNVVVPTLRMTFDLPGVPYLEPCMGNSAFREASVVSLGKPFQETDYHKDRWHKGMVGVVYEVTATDYAHIIATEGGGTSYHDILVACHPLADTDATVPEVPTSKPFQAHTLWAPAAKDRSRPDPSYAQPSARYLKLITDGADEHALPSEYKDYLHGIRPYEARSQRQKLGTFVTEMLWLPFVVLLFSMMQKYQNEDGQIPSWLSSFAAQLFRAVWVSYDTLFKPVFGDGERTNYPRKHKHSPRDEEWGSDAEKRLMANDQ